MSNIIKIERGTSGQTDKTPAIVPQQQKQGDMMGNGQVILQSIPCNDLGKRLAAIYAMAIKRGQEVAQRQNSGTIDQNANDAIGSNNDAVLTSNADQSSARANA